MRIAGKAKLDVQNIDQINAALYVFGGGYSKYFNLAGNTVFLFAGLVAKTCRAEIFE